MAADGTIYFIQVGDDGPIKVGHSVNPALRLSTLQGCHFETLHLIGLKAGSRYDEEKLHEKLARVRLRGEWYAAAPEVLAEIEEPIARVHDSLEKAVAAREHLQSAIALLRAADRERAHEELERTVELLQAALLTEEIAA